MKDIKVNTRQNGLELIKVNLDQVKCINTVFEKHKNNTYSIRIYFTSGEPIIIDFFLKYEIDNNTKFKLDFLVLNRLLYSTVISEDLIEKLISSEITETVTV